MVELLSNYILLEEKERNMIQNCSEQGPRIMFYRINGDIALFQLSIMIMDKLTLSKLF